MNSTDLVATGRQGAVFRQWLVLSAALLGWMFDGLEMGLFSVVARPALLDLLSGTNPGEGDIGRWVSYWMASFLAGAACGGLVFGWLGDRVGRVRAMVLSILVYSCFTGAGYFATAPWQLALLRFLAALGMGGEWALGVALVVESWPEHRRPLLAGVIGAAGNLGYVLMGLIAMTFAVTPQSWRWTMLVCASPAALAVLIGLLIPESPRWQASARRARSNPLREVFGPKFLRTTLLAIAFASVALVGTWGCTVAFLPTWTDHLARGNPHAKGTVLLVVSIGATLGSLLSPLVGNRIGRRWAYFGMCLISLLLCQLLFRGFSQYNLMFLVMAGLVGCATASFYGWLPLYLPELFPTHIRATGQGLSYNFGRLLAMVGVLGAGRLIDFFGGDYPRACATISLVYVLGMLLIWLAPETRGVPLSD